jgi:hypothetical protein
MFQHQSQAAFKLLPVNKTRKGVMGGLVGELFGQPVLCGDIPEGHDRTDDPAVAIVNGCGRVDDDEFLAVAADQDDWPAKTRNFAQT